MIPDYIDVKDTLPETNIFTLENGWLEYYCFLSGWPMFRGYFSFRECIVYAMYNVTS